MTFYIVETFKWCALVGVLLLAGYGPCYLLWSWGDNRSSRYINGQTLSSRVGATAVWLSYTLAAAVTIVFIGAGIYLIDKSNTEANGRHSWEGGSGPNTQCFYEDRDQVVIVGKVPVNTNHVYTVCVDAKAGG